MVKQKKQFTIMQGRLLPRYKNRYQAFPLGYWEAEFFIAKEIGFDFIEFIFDYNDFESNPLYSNSGLKDITNTIKQSDIGVRSVCADYFMEAPLHVTENKKSLKVLENLLVNCSKINIEDIIIPCVDQSALKNNHDIELFSKSIKKIIPIAKDTNIKLNLETDLNPENFKNLLSQIDSESIKVNYDTGNSASLGYNINEEFQAYGQHVSVLHIKDRTFKGSSTQLGTGDVNFNHVKEVLAKHSNINKITLQASRELDYLEDLKIVKKQFKFIKDILN